MQVEGVGGYSGPIQGGGVAWRTREQPGGPSKTHWPWDSPPSCDLMRPQLHWPRVPPCEEGLWVSKMVAKTRQQRVSGESLLSPPFICNAFPQFSLF